jgi:hypothetical protein
MTSRALTAAAAWLAFTCGLPAHAADTAALNGTWEGPWYRGMTSGKAVFQIKDAAKPLKNVEFDGKTFRFVADGGTGPMTAALKLNERGDQMKGMGKYEGFPVRFELMRNP